MDTLMQRRRAAGAAYLEEARKKSFNAAKLKELAAELVAANDALRQRQRACAQGGNVAK